MPAEAAVQQGLVFAAALREDVFAEGGGRRAVEDAPFPEQGEGVGFEDFGPFVGIVSGGLAAGENMGEGGGDAAARDVGQHRTAREGAGFQGGDVVFGKMPGRGRA